MDSDFDWSNFDWSNFNSRYLGLSFNDASSFFPFAFYKNYMSPPRHKAHLIPVEIFSEIFLYTVQTDPRSREKLMLVCRLWYNIMLSTPGIHSQLKIHKATKRKDVERFGKMWLLDVIVDMENEKYGESFDPEGFFISFMAAAQAASRWRSLELVAFPPPGEYKDLQIVLPLQHLETFKLAPSCNLGNFLESLMTTITTTVTPRLTVMEVLQPDAAPYLVQPAHFKIFSSLTTMRLNWRRVQNPMNIFPYLHKIEIFEAHHLLLPISSPCNDIPMIQTLHVLRLKSSSVQWMEDQVFPALEECSIIFPHHTNAIRSVYMPSCSILKYDSNNLGTLEYFHLPPLARLEVKCGQWRSWRGTLQLARLHPIFASQSLTYLHLQIKCRERLLVHMLELVPALEELWMELSSPRALSCAFFLAFAAGERNATAKIGTSSRAIPPLCRELKRLHLHYKRWLRDRERKALMPAFGDIVASHQRLKQTDFSLCLTFDEGSKEQVWKVHGLVENFKIELEHYIETYIGFSSPHGIVSLSTPLPHDRASFQHFRELEYIVSEGRSNPPINFFLPFHSLKEVRIPDLTLRLLPNTPLSTNFPFFHTLKVLDVWSIQSSFLAGQMFHKLERYKELSHRVERNTGLLTEMPMCTRLVVELSRLASLKLPQICELSVFMYGEEFSDEESDGEKSDGREPDGEGPNSVWEMHVAGNSNLSGLKLLHFYDPFFEIMQCTRIELIQILRSLPALETLIIDDGYLRIPYMDFFKAFVPLQVQEVSGLHQSSGGGQMSGVLCPRLKSLQIQGIRLTERPELMPVLNDIVTLRTTIGSPLKSFTFYISRYIPPRCLEQKWELIAMNGMFTMEEVVPAQEFELDI